MEPLPPGFEIRPYIDGPGLYLGDKAVAFACPANHDPAPPWRIAINVGHVSARYHFMASEEAATRYMVAWARRWGARIREAHQGVAEPFAHLQVSGSLPQTNHIRARSRRTSGL